MFVPNRDGGEGRYVRDFLATFVMAGSVFVFSIVPLIIIGANAVDSPFYFSAFWRLGTGAGCLLILYLFFRQLFCSRDVHRLVINRTFHWMLVFMVAQGLEYALFAWATDFIDAAAATVLFYTWPIGFVIIMALAYRREGRYRKNIPSVVSFMALAFLGVAFIVISEGSDLDPGKLAYAVINFNLLDLFRGTSLAILAAVFSSFGAFTFLWGRELADKASRFHSIMELEIDRSHLEVFGAILGFAIGSVLSVPISGLIGVATGGDFQFNVLLTAIFGGFILHAGGTALFRWSNLMTSNLGLNAMPYATSVVALFWMFLISVAGIPFWIENISGSSIPSWLVTLSGVGEVYVPFLVIGTAAIVSANLLINFEAERLLGFKALVVSLWVCGTWVYLRGTESMQWFGKSDAYFDILFLSATVFALILSFRVVRLANRTQEEDNLTFKLFRDLEEMAGRGILNQSVAQYVIRMDEEGGRELQVNYTQARQSVSEALFDASGEDRKKLREIEVDLDVLAHSRQKGINFGEICALVIFAFLVVGTALFSRPSGVQGLTGFLVEMFTMLFPSVIIFLTFNVFDLQRDRTTRILESNPEYRGHGVAFQDAEQEGGIIHHSDRRTWEQRLSVLAGLAIIAAYGVLFVQKWQAWPELWPLV